MKKNSGLYHLIKGFIKENPTLVMMLGMCPTLAITTGVSNALGMGVATIFVLICSNVVISLLKKIIPDTVRLPCFIVVIAGFVTLIEFLLKGYLPELHQSLGIFLPLITVNCIILGRAEAFASKNSVWHSALDGLGMGAGFTLALFAMSSLREIIGAGTWMGFDLGISSPIGVLVMPAGGFFALGCIIAAVNGAAKKSPPAEVGCGGCPHLETCKNIGGGD